MGTVNVHKIEVAGRPREAVTLAYLVCAPVRVYGVQSWPINVYTSQHKRSTNVTLIPANTYRQQHGHALRGVSDALTGRDTA